MGLWGETVFSFLTGKDFYFFSPAELGGLTPLTCVYTLFSGVSESSYLRIGILISGFGWEV